MYALMRALAMLAARSGDGSFTMTSTSSVLVSAVAVTCLARLSVVVCRCFVRMTCWSRAGPVKRDAAVFVASAGLSGIAAEPPETPGPAATTILPVAAYIGVNRLLTRYEAAAPRIVTTMMGMAHLRVSLRSWSGCMLFESPRPYLTGPRVVLPEAARVPAL